MSLKRIRAAFVARRWTILVLGIAVLVMIVATLRWQMIVVQAGNVAFAARKLRLSSEATNFIKDGLVSAAGAILASTAIGISLATFVIQQNVERIPYRAFALIARRNRIIAYLGATIALSLAGYLLAAIDTQRNAWAVAIGGIAIILVFTYVVAIFWLNNMRLLDPITGVTVVSDDRRSELGKRHAEFRSFLNGLRAQLAGKSTPDIIKIGHAHELKVIEASQAIRDIADGFIEEMIPQVRGLASQGDYRAAREVGLQIAELCVAAISYMEDIYVEYKAVTRIWFQSRLGYSGPFGRLLAVAQQARETRDPNLFGIVVSTYMTIAQRLTPAVRKWEREDDNSNNAGYVIMHLADVAEIACERKLIAGPLSCLAAYAELIELWPPDFSTFPYLMRRSVSDIVTASLTMQGAGLTVERGVSCMILLIKRIRAIHPEWYAVRDTLDTDRKIVDAFIARHANEPSEYDFSSMLGGVIGGYPSGAEGGSLFEIMHAAVPPWRTLAQDDPWDDLPLLVPFIDACLDLWYSIGEMITPTALAASSAGRVTERIFECLELCVQLSSSMPAQHAEKTKLDRLTERQLAAFAEHFARFAVDKIFHLSARDQLASLAVTAASCDRPDLARVCVATSLKMATLVLQKDPKSNAEESGGYIYAATILAALDKTDTSVDLVIEQLRSGLWASYVQRFPNAVSVVTGLLQRQNEALFKEDPPDAILYSIFTSNRAKLVELAGIDRIGSMQQHVLTELGVQPIDS